MINKIIEKYSYLSLPMKASAVYLLISLVQKGLAFITSPIFVRMMTSAEYGEMSVYYTDAQLIGTIAMFSLSAGCFDVGMQDFKNNRSQFLFSLLILSNCITILTGAIMFLLYPVIGGLLKISKVLLIAMLVEFMLQPAFSFWARSERYIYNYKLPALITILGAVVSSILSIIAVYLFVNNKVEARVLASAISMLPIYIFFWVYIAKKANFHFNWKYIKFAFLFNFPLIPHYLSSFVLNSSDRLMIINLCGSTEAAYYSLAYNVAAIVTIVWASINSALVPYVFDKYEKKDYTSVSNHVLPILTLFSIFCLLVILLGPEVIKILGTEEYYESVFVIPSVVGGIFFQALYALFTNILYYIKKPKTVMWASISAALLNIILNYFFINMFGYIAAGYTTLVCFLLQAVLDYFVVKKSIGEDIYDMKYLSALSILMLIISIFSNVLYNFTLLRWGVIILILVVIYQKRSLILRIKGKGERRV